MTIFYWIWNKYNDLCKPSPYDLLVVLVRSH